MVSRLGLKAGTDHRVVRRSDDGNTSDNANGQSSASLVVTEFEVEGFWCTLHVAG